MGVGEPSMAQAMASGETTVLPRLRQRAVVTPWQRLGDLIRQKPLGMLGLLVILVTVFAAVFAGFVAPFSPDLTHRGQVLQSPSARFWLGTDHLARDVLTRVIYGARVSLLVGFASVTLGVLGGSALGLLSGYFGGKLDLVLQRIMDAFMAIPAIVLALTILAIAGPGLVNLIIAIAIPQIPRVNRIVRGSVLSEKEKPYIEAARVLGCPHLSVMWRHLRPNVTAPILVIATFNLSTAIIQEASLSFLGVGTPANIPSWGQMLSGESRKFMLVQPWLAVWPGLAITVSVLAWNFLGDALRDLWDPRLRREG
jgi:peptide/nickel transport system permease protein